MIDWTNTIIGVITGLLTGAASSYFVTLLWDKKTRIQSELLNDKMQENQYKTDFSNDIQAICKYLDRLQLELNLEDSENILRVLGERPTTSSFTNGMNKQGVAILGELSNVQADIKRLALQHNLNTVECKQFAGALLKIECDLLKEQASIRKSWTDYKTAKNGSI